MTRKSLHNLFGFRVYIPYFYGAISWACNDKDLIEYFLIENAFNFSLMNAYIMIELSDFKLAILS